jgi:hypothetical protein
MSLSVEQMNAEIRRAFEKDRDQKNYEGRVPFALVAMDAMNPYSGSTFMRPSYVDPVRGHV